MWGFILFLGSVGLCFHILRRDPNQKLQQMLASALWPTAIIQCSKANKFYFNISIWFIYPLNIRGKYCIEYRSQVCCDKAVRKSIYVSVTSDVRNVFLTEILVSFRKFVTSAAFATFPNDFFYETKSYFRDDRQVACICCRFRFCRHHFYRR